MSRIFLLGGQAQRPTTALLRLRPRGQFLEQEDKTHFTARQVSSFNLMANWLNGVDVTPVFEQLQECGFNMTRTWTWYDIPGIGRCIPSDYPDFYGRCPEFARLCESYGLYTEFTAYVGPDFCDRGAHWDQLGEHLKDSKNALLELVNENNVHPMDLSPYQKLDGVLCSHGSNGSQSWPPEPHWDYADFHTNGAFEEQRKIGHNAMEIWSGPTLTNETSRFDEVGMWLGADQQRRKNLAYDSAAGAALLCAGSCFHSIWGKTGSVMPDYAAEVAKAWCDGSKSVDLSQQDQPYVHRQDLETPGVLRVYQRGSAIVYIRA